MPLKNIVEYKIPDTTKKFLIQSVTIKTGIKLLKRCEKVKRLIDVGKNLL